MVVKEGAAHEIQRLRRELYLAELKNERLTKALQQIAAGKMPEDFSAGNEHALLLTATRLCGIARSALNG